MPYYTRDPKRDHNFDNHPYESYYFGVIGPGFLNQAPTLTASVGAVNLILRGSIAGTVIFRILLFGIYNRVPHSIIPVLDCVSFVV